MKMPPPKWRAQGVNVGGVERRLQCYSSGRKAAAIAPGEVAMGCFQSPDHLKSR